MKDQDLASFMLPLADDMHIHLRQDAVLETVTPLIRRGGCDRVVVMPNTKPEITSCAQAAEYRRQLRKVEPEVDYLMTLYLGPNVNIDDLRQNAQISRVTGVKSYPRGVTTNSDAGVESYEKYYPLFAEMEKLGITLHLHAVPVCLVYGFVNSAGEMPGVSPLLAEEKFLPQLHQISRSFPSLRIVLEHVSTAAAVEMVKLLPANVGATITAHHLELETNDVLGNQHLSSTMDTSNNVFFPHNFCKPVAKTREDREALRKVVKEGHVRFFLGSDSAPHPRKQKETAAPAAGVFTTPLLIAYLADTFERLGCLEKLEAFACKNAAAFFEIPAKELKNGQQCVLLEKKDMQVPDYYGGDAMLYDECIVPFRAGEILKFYTRVVPYND